MDKNQAVIDYLLQCPQISNNALYFNFGEASDNSKQIITNIQMGSGEIRNP